LPAVLGSAVAKHPRLAVLVRIEQARTRAFRGFWSVRRGAGEQAQLSRLWRESRLKSRRSWRRTRPGESLPFVVAGVPQGCI